MRVPEQPGLGKIVRAHRGSMSLAQAEGESGISRATLSRIERGRRPSYSTLLTVARWLAADPSPAAQAASVHVCLLWVEEAQEQVEGLLAGLEYLARTLSALAPPE